QESLLRYSDSELNDPCFVALMRFMGDQPKLKNQNEVGCIYEILQVCDLPLGKVLNRVCLVPRCPQFFLSHRESLLRGWLLLNLLTGYFLPSNVLMPYATKFLQQASSDPSSNHHGMAISVPCKTNKKMVRPMRSEEYLHDYLLEDNLITMSLRRVTWKTPLHFENKIYTDVHYGQMLWDYLNGRMLLGYSEEVETQVSILAMLQHWAKTTEQVVCISNGCWHRRGQGKVPETTLWIIKHMIKLPLFGYNIYLVERVSDETIPSAPCLFLLAQICCVIPLKELQKMRTLRPASDGGLPGVELNYGSAASPRTLWIELFLLLPSAFSQNSPWPSSASPLVPPARGRKRANKMQRLCL
uniref:MyTH4 domain-containing protein n=1 Tax=Apteryx owenii TaxID=8824 RepID=A0A8B9SBH3_APTOW